MPIHDWTKVSAGTFHHFHQAWITHLAEALNDGVLPGSYYALAEQVSGDTIPDVLTLQRDNLTEPDSSGSTSIALLNAAPKVQITAEFPASAYLAKQNRLAIRHESEDRLVATLEIISLGNKSGRGHYRKFMEKVVSALEHGINLQLIDLYPPSARDPQGLHGAIWSEIADDTYAAPSKRPLTLAAYVAGLPARAFVEPCAIGEKLTSMPLFLTRESYILAPLEETYQATYAKLPRHLKRELEPETTA